MYVYHVYISVRTRASARADTHTHTHTHTHTFRRAQRLSSGILIPWGAHPSVCPSGFWLAALSAEGQWQTPPTSARSPGFLYRCSEGSHVLEVPASGGPAEASYGDLVSKG